MSTHEQDAGLGETTHTPVRGPVGTEPDLVPTPGQTVGPFFGFALPYQYGHVLAPSGAGAVRLRGVVYDGEGEPIPDALLELWQADADGVIPATPGSLHRDGLRFTGWGRAATTSAGSYEFLTLRPGAVPAAAGAGGGPSAPFIAMTVFARGLLDRLFTRVYLPGDEAALAADPLLASLPEDRRDTLIAREEGGDLIFDVHLQGENETVFLSHSPLR